ncbi:MAG: inositol-3-phosphate synthase [Deltaproteobacteria bacterium]|nr:inositol-3-phosphate synthase [Deltaproteobacteria bacterium]
MAKIRLALAGVGNCASALVQGIEYYRRIQEQQSDWAPGLMHRDIGGYGPGDMEVVAAFDVDARKVGRPVSEAIFAPPNCCFRILDRLSPIPVTVQMGPVLDGVSPHMAAYPPEQTFLVSTEKPVDVVRVLQDSGAEVLLNYMPVGAEEAARFYAECCLKAGVSFINCMPTFIVSDPAWGGRFQEAGIPVVGDDVKSQLGATILHRALVHLVQQRGLTVDRTYQINVGGNTDFLNMLNRERLSTKKRSKTEAVTSLLPKDFPPDNLHIGPSDYIPWQKDNKIAFMRIEARGFGGFPMKLEMRLSVEDSPNSGGCMIDAIRCAKLARDRGIGGPLTSISPPSGGIHRRYAGTVRRDSLVFGFRFLVRSRLLN